MGNFFSTESNNNEQERIVKHIFVQEQPERERLERERLERERLIERHQKKRLEPTRKKLKSPIFGIEGEWLYTFEFPNDKSFGYFICNICNRWWTSAYANKNFGQMCQTCYEYTKPCFMWQNKYIDCIKSHKANNDPPHRSKLCEACSLGQCVYTTKHK
jgi:hypothetical protein